MADTVLAHIAGAIPQKENLATEAVAFIANRSAAARAALASEITRLVEIPLAVAHVATQVAVGDESRPDLVLRDDAGRLLGFVEAKFWAGLTAAQPVEYLRRLTDAGGGVLVMLAPERRLPSLRAEIAERCRAAGVTIQPAGPWLLRGESVHIGFVSWKRVIAVLAAAVAEDVAAASDVRQLDGLCTRFEGEGFIPLTREEIDDLDVPRRVLALANLVNDIVEQAVAEGVLSTRGLKATHYLGATGRYAAFARAGCWIGLSHWGWLAHGRSPLWLRFSADDWGQGNRLRELFRPWAAQDPPRAVLDGDDRDVHIPLRLQTGVEKDGVVADVVRQLREINERMKEAGMPLLSGSAPTES